MLAITYTLTGLGVTVGYHRLFTHRSFKTTRPVRVLLAVLGSMAVEGPVDEWVATHRQHHRFSDHPGDPHSPHVDHAPGWRGALHGLAHAHVGWMFRGKDRANPRRYAKDLLADADLRFISRTFPLWVTAGLALPFGLGFALTGTVAGALTGLLWGGAVRIFLLHHATTPATVPSRDPSRGQGKSRLAPAEPGARQPERDLWTRGAHDPIPWSGRGISAPSPTLSGVPE